VFRSTRRPVLFPQADHARFSAAIAAVWGNDRFDPPPLDVDAFVRGVALHDRGYGEHDTDGIAEIASERWLEIQRESFRPRHEDPIVDLVVGFHVRRLVSYRNDASEMTAQLPELLAAAGVGEAEALAADSITHVCDGIAFDVCFEEPLTWTRPVVPRVGAEPIEITFVYDGEVTLDPWPLAVPFLRAVLVGFAADGYPERLEPVIEPVLIRPG
jgi:uncharacterized protein DUF3891